MTKLNYKNLIINTTTKLSVEIDSLGNITLSDVVNKDTGVVKTKRKSLVKNASGKATQCLNRGELSGIISNLDFNTVKKIRTYFTDSAIRKSAYAQGKTLSVKKVGSNIFTVQRVS